MSARPARLRARVKSRRLASAWLVVLPVALAGTFASWALTSPVGSSPDDDYHLSSTWCGNGERAGVCESNPTDASVRLVPRNVAVAHECFAFRPDVSAGCAEGIGDSLASTNRVNAVTGWYPGGFYRVMGLLVGANTEHSVSTMRVLNALVFIGFLSLALWLLAPAVRSAVVAVVLVVLIPLGLFIIPSTNPTSWTITGITFLWAFSVDLAQRKDWGSWRTWAIAGAAISATAMAMASRVDAFAYVPLTIAVVYVLTGFRALRSAWISAGLLAAIAVVGVVRFVTWGTPGSGVTGGMGGVEPEAGLFFTNAVYLPVYLSGAVGGMGLGWNDTALPPLVFVFGLLALGALFYRGLVDISRRRAGACLVALVVLVAVPMAFMQKEGLTVGQVVQARYLLPLIIVLVATASVATPDTSLGKRGLPLPRPAAIVLGTMMVTSASLSLWVHAHRYAAGTDRGLFDRDLIIDWGGLAPAPWTGVVAAGVLCTIGYVAAAALGMRRDGEEVLTERTGSPTTAYRPDR